MTRTTRRNLITFSAIFSIPMMIIIFFIVLSHIDSCRSIGYGINKYPHIQINNITESCSTGRCTLRGTYNHKDVKDNICNDINKPLNLENKSSVAPLCTIKNKLNQDYNFKNKSGDKGYNKNNTIIIERSYPSKYDKFVTELSPNYRPPVITIPEPSTIILLGTGVLGIVASKMS